VTKPEIPTSIKGLSDNPMPSSSSTSGVSSESFDTSSDIGLHPPVHAAHVATDDKSLLARLAEFASSPPPSEVSAEAPSTLQVSAPVWRDEEFEDFPCDPGGSSSIHISMCPAPTPLFPPPPSKEKMAAPTFYDYPYSFEDITVEPEAGPSAPPFDDPPSAPPTNIIDLTPSAPPLMDIDYCMEVDASAPPLHDWGLDDDPPPPLDEDSHDWAEISIIPPPRPQAVSDIDPFTMRPITSDGTPPRYS
jgi:hypothetical protein